VSFVIALPEAVSAAASDLGRIGSTISAANAAAGADEVSEAIAALFGSHATAYQALTAEADAFHHQFVQLLNGAPRRTRPPRPPIRRPCNNFWARSMPPSRRRWVAR
jgi:PE family protein